MSSTASTQHKIHIIFGATASGKTAYAVELAKKLNGEIINSDSQQVYKEIPILSAEPTDIEKQGILHHLYGFISCFEQYSVGRYIMDATKKIEEVRARGNIPILVGGTGLYIKGLVEGLPEMPKISEATKAQIPQLDASALHAYLKELDPQTATNLKPSDKQRIKRAIEVILESGQPLSALQKQARRPRFERSEYHIIWLNPDRKLLYEKINQRFLNMLERGAIEEVAALIAKANSRPLPKSCGIPEIQAYLRGDITLSEATAKAQQSSRNYAKRQLTWARHQIIFDEALTKS